MKEHIKILIVDDDEDDFYLTSEHLHDIQSKEFNITWAKSFNEGLEKLKDFKFDLCFFDFLLGIKTGIDLLKVAIEMNVTAPIVLFTGKGDQKVDLEAMRLGAMDYLVKSELDAEKLDRCIRYALERAEVLRHLRENETRLKSIFEQMKEAIILKSEDGKIFFHNSTATELLGSENKDIINLEFKKYFLNESDYLEYKKIVSEKGSLENFEIWLLKQNNERIFCSLNSSKQTDIEGKNYHLIAIHDITSRKKLERDRLLAEKSASTARLVRTLAHEVRNPLTNINLSLDQLEPELNDEDLKLFTEIIRRNSNRINSLISELLNSFKQQETNLKPISVIDILNKSLAEAQDRIKLKKIKLKKEYGEDCLLQIDESRITIAFLNLIINAIEAMDSEIGILTIRTHIADNICYVEICDNGTGISPENINKLFEPYFTLKTNGLGLGLASTFTILKSHNASIEVESQLGIGTNFIISFPLAS